MTRSAVTQARDRLGESPMAWLFAHSADHWVHESAARARWRGLTLYGVGGTTLRVQDTEENREHFGLADSGNRGTSGYPLVRLVGLMAPRSHLLAAASFGPYRRGEHWYAADLWPCLPDNSVVVVDRNFWAANVLIPVQRDGTNRHWLIRANANTSGHCIRRLGPRDELLEIEVPPPGFSSVDSGFASGHQRPRHADRLSAPVRLPGWRAQARRSSDRPEGPRPR
ncbi:MAG TPA: hypothetical protein VNM90_27200 [Haliangium sp.]|nr:hypothetical protein [Haliangium sp.]